MLGAPLSGALRPGGLIIDATRARDGDGDPARQIVAPDANEALALLSARRLLELQPKELLLHQKDQVATISINRPGRYNSYTTATLVELAAAMQAASFDDTVGVVVLTGAGERAFCTGGDVREYAATFTQQPRHYRKYMVLFQQAVESILRCTKPVVARLNGMAMGGWNELHLACDLSVAAAHAQLGQVGVGVGSVACGGATQWLPITVGDRRAREMLLLNRKLSAAEAHQWGLVTAVAPTVRHEGQAVDAPTAAQIAAAVAGTGGYRIDLAPLDAAVADIAAQLLAKFPECLRYTKVQTNFWKELAWHQTIASAGEWLTLHFATPEPYEGMRAFVDKRPADIQGMRSQAATGGTPEFLHGPPSLRCPNCNASGLPGAFTYCGHCGSVLAASKRPED